MKRTSFFLPVVAMFVFLAWNTSCSKEDKSSETNISYYGGTKSHHMGQNCGGCHYNGGDGTGWFNVAGTVYDSATAAPYPNTIVRLYTGINGSGTLKYTIEGDANGNFYTTEMIDFVGGLYPAVTGQEITRYMPTAITGGQCNGCHGVSTHRIWAN
jgi:hypothetical protein